MRSEDRVELGVRCFFLRLISGSKKRVRQNSKQILNLFIYSLLYSVSIGNMFHAVKDNDKTTDLH